MCTGTQVIHNLFTGSTLNGCSYKEQVIQARKQNKDNATVRKNALMALLNDQSKVKSESERSAA